MAEAIDLVTRIDRLLGRAATARSAAGLLSEIEDVLAEGYGEALAGDARGRRLAMRLEELVENVDHQREAALQIRRIVLEKRGVDAQVTVLRVRLGELREQFVHLRALSPPG
jgi:hypothetical protein